MSVVRAGLGLVATVLWLSACGPAARTPPENAGPELAGTSWRLVRFQGGDGKTLTPDDRAKYTIAFHLDGSVAARMDCNRGQGTWVSSGPNELRLGPLALTQASCPPGSLHDRIVKDWPLVRSYVLRYGRLFLSLMADGGIYEFEPDGRRRSGRADALASRAVALAAREGANRANREESHA